MILFQLLFEVADDKRAEFETTYAQVFEPALKKQKGFQNVKLIRFYAPAQAAEIEATPTEINYQINFVFDSEANRRVWSKSADHDVAWPKLSGLTKKAQWRGYDILGSTP
jgi:heme-degrading monooxygenase HmoA